MHAATEADIIRPKSRVKILLGLILALGALGLVFVTEIDPVERYEYYVDGPGQVVKLTAPHLRPENEGKMVYFTGVIDTPLRLRDPQLGVVSDAIVLSRTSEIYQWHEKQREEGAGNERYSYYKDWSSTLNKTLSFKVPFDARTNEYHVNPPTMFFRSEDWYAQEVRVGDFMLNPAQLSDLKEFSPVVVPETIISRFPQEWRSRVKIIDGQFYIGSGTPSTPLVGDYRISYKYVPTGLAVTVVGKQEGNRITSFNTQYHGPVFQLREGSVALDSLFTLRQSESEMMEWVMRGAAALLLLVGIKLFFSGLVWRRSALFAAMAIGGGAYYVLWQPSALVHQVALGVAVLGIVLFLGHWLVQFRKNRKEAALAEPETPHSNMDESLPAMIGALKPSIPEPLEIPGKGKLPGAEPHTAPASPPPPAAPHTTPPIPLREKQLPPMPPSDQADPFPPTESRADEAFDRLAAMAASAAQQVPPPAYIPKESPARPPAPPAAPSQQQEQDVTFESVEPLHEPEHEPLREVVQDLPPVSVRQPAAPPAPAPSLPREESPAVEATEFETIPTLPDPASASPLPPAQSYDAPPVAEVPPVWEEYDESQHDTPASAPIPEVATPAPATATPQQGAPELAPLADMQQPPSALEPIPPLAEMQGESFDTIEFATDMNPMGNTPLPPVSPLDKKPDEDEEPPANR